MVGIQENFLWNVFKKNAGKTIKFEIVVVKVVKFEKKN